MHDRELIDQLHVAELTIANGAGDWPHYIAACRALRNSPLAVSRAFGHLSLVTVTGRLDPQRARADIDRFVELMHEGVHGDAESVALSWRMTVAAFSNDLPTAVELVPAVLDVAERTGYLDIGWLAALAVEGVRGWLEGNGDPARRAVIQIETVLPHSSKVTPAFNPFLTAIAELSDGPGVRAQDAVRAVGSNATSGRWGHISSDALILLAELTRLEGDADHARDLLRATSSGRSPASILAGHQIAERLGIHDEIEAAYVANASNQAWMLDRPRRALLTEMDRRSWING